MNSILADAKRIASQPMGVSKPIHPGDAIRVARELLRLLDDTPADREWYESIVLAGKNHHLFCDTFGEWRCGMTFYGKKTRGQVRCLSIALGSELKEAE